MRPSGLMGSDVGLGHPRRRGQAVRMAAGQLGDADDWADMR